MITVPLADVVTINPRHASIAPDDPVSFVGMAELDADTAVARPRDTREFTTVSKGYTVFQDDDILAAKITPCWENGKVGQAKLAHRIGVGSTEFHVFRPGPRVDPRYLLHFLRRPEIRAAGTLQMTGSGGQRRVPLSFFPSMELPLPTLAEQERIGAILDRATDVCLARRASTANSERLADSIFHQMFGGSNAVDRTVKLGDIATLVGGRNLVAGDTAADSTFRVLKISAVTSGIFKPWESKPLPVGYVPPGSHLVREGDLLISRANTAELVGAAAYVDHVPGALALPDKIWRFEWRDDMRDPIFYHALLRSRSVRRRISQMASGTGGSMKNVSKKKLEDLDLPDVGIERQRSYAALIADIPRPDGRRLDELFSSLRNRAFRGEL